MENITLELYNTFMTVIAESFRTVKHCYLELCKSRYHLIQSDLEVWKFQTEASKIVPEDVKTTLIPDSFPLHPKIEKLYSRDKNLGVILCLPIQIY
jgi:hypothetical protein